MRPIAVVSDIMGEILVLLEEAVMTKVFPMKRVAYFATQYTRVSNDWVVIFEEVVERVWLMLLWSRRSYYHAYYVDSNVNMMRLGGKFETLAQAKVYVATDKRCMGMEEITDPGEIGVFCARGNGAMRVSLKPEYGCIEPVPARDVPVGARLIGINTQAFFRFWLGEEAVDLESGRLVKK